MECLTINGIKNYESKLICQEFASHFSSVGKKFAEKIDSSAKSVNYYTNKLKGTNSSIFFFPATYRGLEKIIDSMPCKNSSGHDQVSNKLLKEIKKPLLEPLLMLINKSLSEGWFPTEMKKADVVPLHKGKRVDLVSNYRPISLLLTISKILEKIVYKRTYQFLDSNSLLFKSQYGFRTKHSCEHAVEELISNVLKNNENSKYTVAIYLDLSKAFDTISHNVLLQKLNKYGIRGKAHNWFKHYLENRYMRCKCTAGDPPQSEYSSYYELEYGAPQGSCLGPLLFMIFVNDLYLNLDHCQCILFADDTTIYLGHRDLRYLKWCIESDLENIATWFKANKLTLNIDKTVGMLFSPQKKESNLEIKINGKEIPMVKTTQFLGLWIDSEINWNAQLNNLLLKLQRNMYMLKVSKNLLVSNCKKMLYYAQFFSHLTYGMILWGPMINSTAVNKLQKLQNNCMKLVFNKMPTWTELNKKGILSIKQLIKLELLKTGYKLHHKLLPTPIINCFVNDHSGKSLIKKHKYGTRNKAIPNNPKPRTKLYQSSFLCKSISEYSSLLVATTSYKNFNQFVSKCKTLLHERLQQP